MVRGDQPHVVETLCNDLQEIARRYGFKTEKKTVKVFEQVLEVYNNKIVPCTVYLQSIATIREQTKKMQATRLNARGEAVPVPTER